MYRQKKVMAEYVSQDRETRILRELGVEPDMIDYLMHMKQKEAISSKWNN